MARVKNHNKANKGTAKGMTKFGFMGSPPDQYEIPEGGFRVGEERVIPVTVRCMSTGPTYTDDGIVDKTKWKVVNAALGERVESPQGELDYESGADGEYSESYGTGQPIGTGDGPKAETAPEPADEAGNPEESTPDQPDEADEPTASVHEFPVFSGKSKSPAGA